MKTTQRRIVCSGMAVLAIAMAGCTGTQLRDAWKDPATSRLQFNKVVVMAITDDDVARKVAEDEMVRQVRQKNATQSYQVLDAKDLTSKEQAKAKLMQDNFDGAVTMRLVSIKERPDYVTSDGPDPFWGYYGSAWHAAYEPGYWTTNTMAYVQTRIYSLKDGKLLWSGTSETFEPSSARQLVAEVAKEVGGELRREGLLQKS